MPHGPRRDGACANRKQIGAPPSVPAAQPRPGRTPAPIVLNADDKAAFPSAPIGFDQKREGVALGTLELVEYKSTTVGTNRHMLIYTSPSYSAQAQYPVLYLLHGIGGDEHEWQRGASVDVILDNLISQRLHTYLKEKEAPHVWHVDSGRHDFKVWKNDLYLFSQRIFR